MINADEYASVSLLEARMWLLWVMVVVGACLADQPLPSSQMTTTSPLHTVNVKVAEAGDDFCASSLPLLQVILGLPYSDIGRRSRSGAIFQYSMRPSHSSPYNRPLHLLESPLLSVSPIFIIIVVLNGVVFDLFGVWKT